VTAIVVGADDAEQVRGNIALLSAPPPRTLWDELRERGLIRGDAPVPQSPGR
jgi:D-threo-aldose 1-dehydrogenase